MKRVDTTALTTSMAGTARNVIVHRYQGRATHGQRGKAYIQASLHADELPGMIAAHHLIRRLDALDHAGRIRGDIVVVPMANPIGLDQWVIDRPLGRFSLSGCGNFNRGFPDLTDATAALIDGRLSSDPADNIRIVRDALCAVVAAIDPISEVDGLRKLLLSLAIDADLVLDLHCDDIALPHLYTGTALWPRARPLAARLGMPVALLAADSGGGPFDEACSKPWWLLGQRFADQGPIPPACLATTVELRGLSEVEDDLGAADADAIIGFLADEGMVDLTVPPSPQGPEATPLSGVDLIASPAAGLIAYKVNLGDWVAAGETIAELIDPLAEDQSHARTPINSGTDGLVFAIASHRFVRAGDIIGKVAGALPLSHRVGPLLTD